jgi:hypothetical protein
MLGMSSAGTAMETFPIASVRKNHPLPDGETGATIGQSM